MAGTNFNYVEEGGGEISNLFFEILMQIISQKNFIPLLLYVRI